MQSVPVMRHIIFTNVSALALLTLAACSSGPTSESDDDGAAVVAAPAPSGSVANPASAPEALTAVPDSDPRIELQRVGEVGPILGADGAAGPGACGQATVITVGPPRDMAEAEGLQVIVMHAGKPYEAGFVPEPDLKCVDGNTLSIMGEPGFHFDAPPAACDSAMCKLVSPLVKSFFTTLPGDKAWRAVDTAGDTLYVNHESWGAARVEQQLFAVPRKALGKVTKAEATASGGLRLTGTGGSVEISAEGTKATVVRSAR